MVDEPLPVAAPDTPTAPPGDHCRWQQMAGLAFVAQGLAGVTQKGLAELPGDYRVFYLCCTYLVAATLSYALFRRRGGKIPLAAVIVGAISGTTCVLSVYFVLAALKHVGAVVVFSIVPPSALALTVLAGWLVFGERLSRRQAVGVLLALAGIVLVQL